MALSNLKGTLRNASMGLAALGMAAGPTVAPAFAQSAQVQQTAAYAQDVAIQDINIPVRDLRDNQIRGVQMMAAMASKDTQLMIFYGDSQDALDQTFYGAKQAVASGVPLAGVIVASPAEPDTIDGERMTGTNRVEFYADGQRTGAFDRIDTQPHRVAGLVRNELLRGQDIMQSRRALAMAPSAGR